MKLYIIAGEASGDLHGSNLIKALLAIQPETQCRVWGGDLMAAAGGTVVKHYRDLAFMGFVEVVANLRTILSNIRFCKTDIEQFQPDLLVLIDYPGFNLRIAKWAKSKGIRVVYYISPQIWAWHTSRVHDIKRDVDKLIVILPFEQAFFQKYNVESAYVGHPLLDAVPAPISDAERATSKIVAILPGSRKQEVRKILPRILSIVSYFPEYQFVIGATSSLGAAYYRSFIPDNLPIEIVENQTYALLNKANFALVKSGTSTLETALFRVPQVVCYAGNPISYQIAKRLVDIQYISLVNLILDRPLVKELIQHELQTAPLKVAIEELIEPMKRQAILDGYTELRTILGDGGASAKAAKMILDLGFTNSEGTVKSAH